MSISPNSDQIIHMIATLLSKRFFPVLTSLDLRFNPNCQATENNVALSLEQKSVSVYQMLKEQMYGIALPEIMKKLNHLGVILWLDSTKYALTALDEKYPHLKSLAIDIVMPTHKLKSTEAAPRLERKYSVGDLTTKRLEQKK